MQPLLSRCLQSPSRNRHAKKCIIQNSKALPWRYLQSAVGTWKRGKGHLPREVRDSFTEEVVTELRWDQWSGICHVDRRADRMTGAKTHRGHRGPWEEQAMQCILSQRCEREKAGGVRPDHEEPVDQSSMYSPKAIG